MDNWNLKELGDLLRRRREELGLKQKELEDEFISSSTISNLETGKKRVGRKKLSYYLKKLGWSYEDLPKYLAESSQQEQDESTRLELELRIIENDIDCVSATSSLLKLNKLQLRHDHPQQALIEYLKGKCFYKKEKWDKSHFHYQQAISLIDAFPKSTKSNLKAAAYYGLGQVYYRKNDLNNALDSVSQGLAAIIEDGERIYLKYHLLLSKAIYLEKLERYAESLVTLDTEMWPYLSEIDTEVQLNMYELHATLLNKQNMSNKAIRYAESGIDIARRVKNYDRCFELWTALGTAYKNLGFLDLAEKCFQAALRFENKVNKKQITAYNYIELGLLYQETGQTELAEENLKKAVTLSRKTPDGFRQFDAHFATGKFFLQQKKIKEAIAQFEMAREISEKHGLLKQERDVCLELIQYYEKIDLVKYKKCFARFFELSVQLLNRGDEKMPQSLHSVLRKNVADPPDA